MQKASLKMNRYAYQLLSKEMQYNTSINAALMIIYTLNQHTVSYSARTHTLTAHTYPPGFWLVPMAIKEAVFFLHVVSKIPNVRKLPHLTLPPGVGEPQACDYY